MTQNNKFYVRAPSALDAEGSYVRIFGTDQTEIAIGDVLQKLEQSTVTRIKDRSIYLHCGPEEIRIVLPELAATLCGWIWLPQPQYRPGSTLKGFVVIRERLSEYMTALRVSAHTDGQIRLVNTDTKQTMKVIPWEFQSIVNVVEIELDEHYPEGPYELQVGIDKKPAIATYAFTIAHYEKNDINVQCQAPKWVLAGEECVVQIRATYFHGGPVNGELRVLVDPPLITPPPLPTIRDAIMEDLKQQFAKKPAKKSTKKSTKRSSPKSAPAPIAETIPVVDGFAHYTPEWAPGTHHITCAVTDDHHNTGTTDLTIEVTDHPAQLTLISPATVIYTHIPATFTLELTTPAHEPIPEQSVTITWTRIGKTQTTQIGQETFFTEASGRAIVKQYFDHEGTYQIRAETEIAHDQIVLESPVTVERITQGILQLKATLDTPVLHEGEPVTGTITLRGHPDTIQVITTGYADLVTDKIVETKTVTITPIMINDDPPEQASGTFRFDGIVDFTGPFAVEIYLRDPAIITPDRDAAGCVMARIEGTVEPPYDRHVNLTMDCINQATTGEAITLDVAVDGALLEESFHVFGALVDERAITSHLDPRFDHSFLTMPQAMKVQILTSKAHTRPPPPPPGVRPTGAPPPPSGSPRVMLTSMRSSINSEISSLFTSRGRSYDDGDSYSYSASAPSASSYNESQMLGSLRDEMAGELERLKRIMGREDLSGGSINATAQLLTQVIRQNFAESVIIPPTEISAGHCQIPLTLPDSITRYVILLFGCNTNQFGTCSREIVVRNPIFTTIKNPATLTYGDECDLVVTVHNTTQEALPAVIEIQTLTGITIQEDHRQSVTIAASGEASVTWRVKADQVGPASLELDTITETFCERSGLDQPLYVKPPNLPIELPENITLSADHPAELIWNVAPEDVYAYGELCLLPNYESDMIVEWQHLIQYPHGCCEQTCASTLPNVIVFEYLDAKKALTPSLKDDLIHRMEAGRDRLLGYHNTDGGFSYWGQGSTPFYTALALSVMMQLKRHIPVNESIFTGAQAYLAHWKHDHHWCARDFGGHGTVAPTNLSDVGLTAYIAHSLSAGGAKIDRDVIEWLIEQQSTDGAVLGMLIEILDRAHLDVSTLVETLLEQAYTDHYWGSQEVITHTDHLGSVEATAYAVIALCHACDHRPNLRLDYWNTVIPAVEWLLSQRTTHGWASTRDTLLAMQAIAAAECGAPILGTVHVTLNETEIFTDTISPETAAWKIYDFQRIRIEPLQPGENRITVTLEGKGTGNLTALFQRWQLHAPSVNHAPMRIEWEVPAHGEVDLKLPTELVITPELELPSVMVEQKIPALCQVGNLDAIQALCDHAEIQGDTLCIFFALISEEIRIPIVLSPQARGTCVINQSRAYEMYDPTIEIAPTSDQQLIIH